MVTKALLFLCSTLLLTSCATNSSSKTSNAEPAVQVNAQHPLDPLTAEEISLTSELIKNHAQFPKGALFAIINLKEPAKDVVKTFKAGQKITRESAATVYDKATNQSFAVVTNLTTRSVTSFEKLHGIQPMILDHERETVQKVLNSDPRWQEAMRRRGFPDLSKVWVDAWAPSTLLPNKKSLRSGARLLRAVPYLNASGSNYYGSPIEGVGALIDMNKEAVVDFYDNGAVPVAARSLQFDEKSIGRQRQDIKPLRIVQEQGPSFKINGQEIEWQNWRFRFTMHARDALILQDVRYNDNGRLRPILFRGSLSETVVPYGDTDANWSWRNAFDEGEYGLGRLSGSMVPVMDAPENAVFFDAVFPDDFGKPYVAKRVVALYERDGGLLWNHYDWEADVRESRRARQLVITCVTSISNYDYAITYIFHQDGSLEFEIGASGIMLAKGVKQEKVDDSDHSSHNGHLVAKNVAAPHHQHFFNYRLDLDVDGEKNSVAELDTSAAPPSKNNPHLNAIQMNERILTSEISARRNVNLAKARKWKVLNPTTKNSLGYKTSYLLLPGEQAVPYLSPKNPTRVRGGFIDHNLWITKYKPTELYAAGEFPNQNFKADGLMNWTEDNESVVNSDVVMWYTFGVTHVPRPEEWPVMPTHRLGFRLVPAGFFDQNPAMDVPRSK